MGVGYLSVNNQSDEDCIDWTYIKSQKTIEQTKFFTHARLAGSIQVIMNGKKGRTLIKKDH
jgi:hypothetical protein